MTYINCVLVFLCMTSTTEQQVTLLLSYLLYQIFITIRHVKPPNKLISFITLETTTNNYTLSPTKESKYGKKIPLELKDLNRNTFNKKLTAHYINDYRYKI